MNISDKFKGNFTFKYIDGKNWLLTSAVTYIDSVMGDICVPVYVEGDKEYGFVTDGASSPSVSWAIMLPRNYAEMIAISFYIVL